MNAQNVESITGQIDASGGVSVDQFGNVYIGDYGDALNNANGTTVYKIDLDHNLSVFASGFSGATGNVWDSQGNFYQANISGNRVNKITPSGVMSNFATNGIFSPVGLTIDDQDNIYVANCGNNTIRKLTPSGISTLFASGGMFSCPNGITADENNNIYVANFSNGNVIRITPTGTTSIIAVIPGNNNGHLTYKNGFLWVASHGSNKIYQVTLDGDISVLAGVGFRGNSDGPWASATFSLPNGIEASLTGDTLYVNSSIPIFPAPGTPLNPSVVRMITGVNTIVSTEIPEVERTAELSVFPNPFRLETVINFYLPGKSVVDLSIFDSMGRKVRNLLKGEYQDGAHDFNVEGHGLSNGLYLIKLESRYGVISKKLVVVND